jgi:hypothetical protein
MGRNVLPPSRHMPQWEVLEPRLLLSAAAPTVAEVAPPPVITAIAAKYDGNADPAVLGRYIGGVSVQEKITAKVRAVRGDPVASVTFKVGDTEYVDSNAADGWSLALNMGALSQATPLVVTALSRSGVVSNAFTGRIDVVPMPSWVAETGAAVTFSAAKKGYLFHVAETLMEKSVEVPVECVLLGGKTASAGCGMTMDLGVSTSPVKAIASTITGNLLVQVLGKQIVSKTWKAPAAYDPTKPFNAALALDPDSLEIDSLEGSLVYVTESHKGGALDRCPVAAYFGVAGKLAMDTTVDADVGFHYVAGSGILPTDGSMLNVNTTASLTGAVNTVRSSFWPPILKWGFSGDVDGTVRLNLTGTYNDPGPVQWTGPFSAHIWAQLTGSDPVELFLESQLGSLTPDLLRIVTDLA